MNPFEVILIFMYILDVHSINCDNCPPLYTRQDWNASMPREIKSLRVNPPPYIAVHHSATQSCLTVSACKKLVKSIQNYHMIDNDWEDIGYNFLIGGDGNIYEGRGWGIHGAHLIPYNARSIGICLLGNFTDEEPPNIQIQALKQLIRCAENTKKVTNDYHLIGHSQGSATLCPGKFVLNIIKGWPHFDTNPQ
ncbi:peptidoglycan recognition protein-like [Diorhabda sublineata]|uniref:peptidoglycan recognition protein-like n=1 Tax=Diorhabda sublineata TaxID=1163346 RepID=UPI0024E04C05|nr:peptidoglycan recognition protein-like [Diorhabda sublineata]